MNRKYFDFHVSLTSVFCLRKTFFSDFDCLNFIKKTKQKKPKRFYEMLNYEKLIGKQTSCINSSSKLCQNVHKIIFGNDINYFLLNNKYINHI